MNRNWIAVASAEHVRIGQAGGFMQVCHGKVAPLRRLRPGDRVVYYSPTKKLGGANLLQCFTALGRIVDGEPYQVNMGGGFLPFRRNVHWLKAKVTPITPLLGLLEFSAGKKNWGYPLRFGLFEVSDHDFERIAQAMGVESLKNG